MRDGLLFLFFLFFLVHAPGCLRPTHCRVCNNTAIYTIRGGEYENGKKAFQKDKLLLPRKNAERENAEQLVALLDMVMTGVAQKKESREKTTTTTASRIIGLGRFQSLSDPHRHFVFLPKVRPNDERLAEKKHKRKKAHT